MNRENFVGILLYSVIPMVICAFCFVYGLICCVKFHMEGQTIGENKQYRKMFLLAGGSLTLLFLLPNPWVLLSM